MKIVCAWCGKLIKKDTEKDGNTSHGICDNCSYIERKKNGIKSKNN